MKIPATFTARMVDTVTGVGESVIVRFSPSLGLFLPLSLLRDLRYRGLVVGTGCVTRMKLDRRSSPWLPFFKFASFGATSHYVLVSA